MKIRDLLSASIMLGVGFLLTWIVAGALESNAAAGNASAASGSSDVALHQTPQKRF
jgi:hypothetical protein